MISLSSRQLRQVRRIERELHRSEPHLAAMLAIFARLNVGEAVVRRQRAGAATLGARLVLGALAGAMVGLAVAAHWVFRGIARLWITAFRRLSGTVQVPAGTSSGTDSTAGSRPSTGL